MKAERTRAPDPFAELLTAVEKDVTGRLRAVLAASEAEAKSRGPDVKQMVRAVSSLTLRGGKRLRATLCLVGGHAVSARTKAEPLLHAGVAVELLQSYLLIHDDWMDGDSLRRGGPTAHVALAAHLGSDYLGERSGVLAGDHALALAQLELARVDVTAERKVKALRTFAQMQIDAVAGQQRDLVGRTDNPELTYFLKTASYTVTGPLVLGAELAGARAPTLEALRAFGSPAGIAFQLRDDLIGAFGEPAVTGKPRGADLLAGKSTPLLRHGQRLLSGASRRRLDAIVGKRRAASKDVEQVLTELERSGARAVIEKRIEHLRRQASQALTSPHITPKGRELLAGALDRLLVRHA